MFWALLCPIQVSFQVQLGPKMGDLWLKYMRPQKCTIFMAKIAPNGGLVPGQRNPPGNWLLNGPYGKNSPWVHVKKMGLSYTRYSKYPMNLVRIGYWKLFWIWVGYRVLVGHCLIVLYMGLVFLQLDTCTGLQNICLVLTGKWKKYIISSFTTKWKEFMEWTYLILYLINVFKYV